MKYTISVVSHNSGKYLQYFLQDLCTFLPNDSEIILTINVPEDEEYLAYAVNLPLMIIRNSMPYGFGENHNRAFRVSKGNYFIVVNPDIRLFESPFEALEMAFTDHTGACAPRVLSPDMTVEDSVRIFPTILGLIKRIILRRRIGDYCIGDGRVCEVDWVAGMFIMFRADVYREVDGFDSCYFMYMEDVDICRRLWKRGFKVNAVFSVSVIHFAQRDSRKSLRHLRWHIRSAIRLLLNF